MILAFGPFAIAWGLERREQAPGVNLGLQD